MSDHLPECDLGWAGDPHGVLALPIPHHEDCPFYALAGADPDANLCPYCPPLRACEQRVLDAAREAVVAAYAKDSLAVRSQTEWGIEIALAAIDALKRERSENPDTPPSAENPDNPLTCGECQTEIGLDDVGCLHLADDDDHGHIGTLAAIDALRKENR